MSDTHAPYATTAPRNAAEAAPHDAHPRESWSDFCARARHFDESRPSFAGEHALAFAGGVGLILLAFGRTPLLRAAVAATGGALIVRSLTGRDGLASLGIPLDDRAAHATDRADAVDPLAPLGGV